MTSHTLCATPVIADTLLQAINPSAAAMVPSS